MDKSLKIKAAFIVAVILICIYGIIGLPKSKEELGLQLEQQHQAWPRSAGWKPSGAPGSGAGRFHCRSAGDCRAAEGRSGQASVTYTAIEVTEPKTIEDAEKTFIEYPWGTPSGRELCERLSPSTLQGLDDEFGWV